MALTHDGSLTIAIGQSRKDLAWKNQEVRWSEMVSRLATPKRTGESLADFSAMPKGRQDDLKDIGGFVGGTLKGGRRMATAVAWRQVVALDADFGKPSLLTDLDFKPFAWCLYTTRKHGIARDVLRARILIPLARPVTPDEYQAVSRRLAADFGLDQFDDTTHEPARLMYWPSCSADSEYLHQFQDAPWVDPDAVLARYDDWRDQTQWPTSEVFQRTLVRRAERAGDPEGKSGLVGLFCRCWGVASAIETHLSDAYAPTKMPGRYTYSDGSSVGGLVVYEDRWAYSHHGTDPASGVLCNAWDLVRLHRYGDLDVGTKADTPINRMPSSVAMGEWAKDLPEIKRRRAEEQYAQLQSDFGTGSGDSARASEDGSDAAPIRTEHTGKDWALRLAHDRHNKLEPTRENYRLILTHHELLKGLIAFDEFHETVFLLGDPPWRSGAAGSEWSDLDRAGLMHFLERAYATSPPTAIVDDALTLVQAANAFHPVRDYLGGLVWDGVERLDRVFTDYLGADDTEYVHAVARKSLTGAVARVFQPGCKFDYMVMFTGAQGNGKSTLVRTLGGDWTSDSLYTVQGKDAFEQLRGAWLIEMAELTATKRADVEAVKQFLTKTTDRYRAAYARYLRSYPRQCVFFGTTNERTPLVDRTGNRRFWVVAVYGTGRPIAQWQPELAANRDQIWAEAVVRYKEGEKLYLEDALLASAEAEQEAHRSDDGLTARIERWLEELVPEDWQQRSIKQRLNYYDAEFDAGGPVTRRDRVCAREVWVECLRGNEQHFNRGRAVEINDAMRVIEGWEESKTPRKHGPYGSSRCFLRATTLISDMERADEIPW